MSSSGTQSPLSNRIFYALMRHAPLRFNCWLHGKSKAFAEWWGPM